MFHPLPQSLDEAMPGKAGLPTRRKSCMPECHAAAEWQTACASMLADGFKQVSSFNPYWEMRDRTYEDPDGYRIVLQQAEWNNVEKS